MTLRGARIFPLLFSIVLLSINNACSPSIGPSHPWISADQIQGPLRPEVSDLFLTSPRQFAPGETVRVTTFNLHRGEDVTGIVRAIQEDDAISQSDILLFQEIRDYPSEVASRTSRIAEALGMAYVYAPAKEVEGGTHGLAILSRFTLENISVMELPAGELIVDNERRIALASDIQMTGQLTGSRLRLINVHLDTRLNANERILQLRPAVIDAPEPSLVAGDFNSNPLIWAFNAIPILPLTPTGGTDQSLILDDYMRSIRMATPTVHFGATVDFPILEPRLDSIYLRGLNSGEGAVERDVTVSDHWPLWLDIRP